MMLNEKQRNRVVVIAIVVIFLLLLWTIFLGPFLSFKKHEKELLDGAKRYYDINSTKLPTGTKIGTISLLIPSLVNTPLATKITTSIKGIPITTNNSIILHLHSHYNIFPHLEGNMYYQL